MRTPKFHKKSCKVTHKEFQVQSLIVAQVQSIAECTSSLIQNSQATEIINLYKVIWTVISHLVLYNSGALLNHSSHGVNLHSVLLLACAAFQTSPATVAHHVFRQVPCCTPHLEPLLLQFNYNCTFKTQKYNITTARLT